MMIQRNFWKVGVPGILAITLLLFACGKDNNGFPTSCRLSKVTLDGQITTQAYYNAQNRIERFTTYDTSTMLIDADYRVYRNSAGKIDSVYRYNTSGDLDMKYKMILNLNQDIGRVDMLTDPDNDGVYELANYYEIVYNSSGDITEMRRFSSGGNQNATYTFTWENGNVVEFDNDGQRWEMDFDDKYNLYIGVGEDVLFLNPSLLPLVMSINNPTEVRIYNQLDILQSTITVSYLYNDNDLPSQSVSNVSSSITEYEYNCD